MAAQPIMETEMGYDPINLIEINVGDWLNQDQSNLVIRYNNTNHLLSTAILKKQLENQRAKQVKCSTTNDTVKLSINTNPVRYMDLTLVGITGVAVERKDIELIISNITRRQSSRLYDIVPVSSGSVANSLYGFIQSNAPDSITIAPQISENEPSPDISKCNNGILFNRKIVELNKVSGGKIHRNKSKRNTKKKSRKNITRKNRKNKSKKM
jgi:hypothetical protein